ncbi:MAG TPA: NAD(P)H-dependent glycerol-3-phosphate dehydrogenase [Clostridiaceae bacterium]|nr:NAD(P)H-dependent glycerol-3-phosphate dehydrogenase [Clostridiaceae bacterium]
MRIGIIGAGSFGTALGYALGKQNHDIVIWDRKETIVDEINLAHTNTRYVASCILGDRVTATLRIEEAVRGMDFVLLAVPSHVIREICRQISGFIRRDTVVISVAKGFDPETKDRLSVTMEEILSNPLVVLSGPSHAEEVSQSMPTTLVASSKDMAAAGAVQDVFSSDTLRVYTNEDLIGVEIGGAVKNIIALAAGILDGIGYGDNAKAALMTRGMAEIIRIGEAMGAKKETFYGLTGMGDLIVTCTSKHSRNRRAGILIGQGSSTEEATERVGMVVEGIKAAKVFHELKTKLGIEMPITEEIYSVLFEGKDLKEAIKALMTREMKSE